MRTFFLALAVSVTAAATLTACAKDPDNPGTMAVKTNGAVVGSLAGHKTYAYQAVAPPPAGDAQWDMAAIAIAEVKTRIDEEMGAKGYVLDEHPELMVKISIGVREEMKEPTGAAASARTDVPAIKQTMADLDIDVYDYSNGGQLFHGHAQDEVHHRQVDKDKLAKAVRLILEPVPPARS